MQSFKLTVVILSIVLTTCLAGKRQYGEECSTLSQIGQIFTGNDNDNPNACDTSKGFFCNGGKCGCQPGNVYEKGIIGGLFGTGQCYVAANIPCLGRECTSNAKCGDDTSSLCSCKDGYHSRDGYCTNGSNKSVGASYLYLIAMLLSYFVLTK